MGVMGLGAAATLGILSGLAKSAQYPIRGLKKIFMVPQYS